MPKKGASIFGLLIGIAIVVVGICLLDINFYRSSATVGRDIRFGADFYTEMYDVTRDVGYQVSQIDGTIAAATRWMCQAIGWLIISLGAIDMCYFISKLATETNEKENAVAEGTQYVAETMITTKSAPIAETPVSITEDDGASNAVIYQVHGSEW